MKKYTIRNSFLTNNKKYTKTVSNHTFYFTARINLVFWKIVYPKKYKWLKDYYWIEKTKTYQKYLEETDLIDNGNWFGCWI
jgi:hypothetical protein